MQKDTRKKNRAYKASMLLKYWKATNKEPIMDLCMIIAMYSQDIEVGFLYAVGHSTAFNTREYGSKNINTLSRIILENEDGEEALVKGVTNGSNKFHAFLMEDRTVRVVKKDGTRFDIALGSKIIALNSGNWCNSLFIVDAKMRAYEIKNETPVRVTGLPDGINIKDVSCGANFTVFMSECGRVFGMGSNYDGELGLPYRIKEIEIPTEITFPNQSDSDKNKIMITMIHASWKGWVAVDYKQRAWIVGNTFMRYVRSDYRSLDPCISIIEVWYLNDIRITQIECGYDHAIALDAEGRVYWFGKFGYSFTLSSVSLDPIPFSHRIMEIRSGYDVVACKDATNEWYVWGKNTHNNITGLCGCEAVCKGINDYVISNPMKCKWQGLFDAARVINLQLRLYKAYVIVDSV